MWNPGGPRTGTGWGGRFLRRGRVVAGIDIPEPLGEEDDLIANRITVVKGALLGLALGVAWLSAGCGDSGKSDGQIQSAPEASSAAQAVSKNYSDQMAKKYGNRMKGSR